MRRQKNKYFLGLGIEREKLYGILGAEAIACKVTEKPTGGKFCGRFHSAQYVAE
jgi:hypothetical protein